MGQCALPRVFQPTLPARGATRRGRLRWRTAPHFNPRSPHGERLRARLRLQPCRIFQPTLPARGATSRHTSTLAIPARYFNPRSPHGERRSAIPQVTPSFISTHAPRTGSDVLRVLHKRLFRRFQPTLPARGATLVYCNTDTIPFLFQPTLPARGATCCCWFRKDLSQDFNPRSPHGERHNDEVNWSFDTLFQPTLPARGATALITMEAVTAPHFNPRSPHGERQHAPAPSVARSLFQPTLPARGATDLYRRIKAADTISTHAPRTGSD